MADQDNNQISSSSQYGVSPIPYHTHNGTDSPTISQVALNGVSSVAASGAGISASPTTGNVVVSNTGVTSIIAGSGISIDHATGAVTISLGSPPVTGIVFDNITQSTQNSVSSLTQSHTATGSNLVAFIDVLVQSGDNLTSITYSGLTPTLVDKKQVPTAGFYIYSYLVSGVPAGPSNVIVTTSGSTVIAIATTTYSGSYQSATPDNHASGSNNSSSVTQAVVTVADKCWLHMAVGIDTSANPSAGANTVVISTSTVGAVGMIVTHTGALETPAGSYSQTLGTGGSHAAWVLTSFAPA